MGDSKEGGDWKEKDPVKVRKEAEAAKELANEAFKNHEYEKAVELYTKAVELCPSAVYFANRSIANLRLECGGYALADATKAIAIDKTYTKAYYRRAAAYLQLGKFKEALKDFEAVVRAHPNDKDAKLNWSQCNKIVKKMAFERAIAVNDSKKSVADTIEIDVIVVEESYEGPRLIDGSVTESFMEELMLWFKNQKTLHKKFAYQILLGVKKYFMDLPSLIDIRLPDDKEFTICGDIHGQYYDLLNIFAINGLPSIENPYLFNGDFVDRGSFSVECILTLFGFKLLYPTHFFMARGNHESESMNQMYGFSGECKSKYNEQMAEFFTEVYNWLPLCHCINNRVFVMHGGLFSKENVTLDEIRGIDRNRQPPEEGLMCELLWSDPQSHPGIAPSKRGVGIQFGPDVTERFLTLNKLDYIIRSHEVKADGYEVAHDGHCITIFSAPNYCDSIGNKGALIRLKGDELLPKFHIFGAVAHPDVRPMAYANSLLSMMS